MRSPRLVGAGCFAAAGAVPSLPWLVAGGFRYSELAWPLAMVLAGAILGAWLAGPVLAAGRRVTLVRSLGISLLGIPTTGLVLGLGVFVESLAEGRVRGEVIVGGVSLALGLGVMVGIVVVPISTLVGYGMSRLAQRARQ
jgi:hypothetical protein